MAEPVDQNATQTLLGLSFHQAIISTTSLSFCLSELKQFTHILWGLVKVIRGNAGYQYLKLKYTNQDKGYWVHKKVNQTTSCPNNSYQCTDSYTCIFTSL